MGTVCEIKFGEFYRYRRYHEGWPN